LAGSYKNGMKMKIRECLNRNTKWVFTIPVLLFVVICIGYPIVYALIMSFHSWRMSPQNPPVFVGLKNYISIFKDSRTFNAVLFTFKYFLVSSVFEVVLGVALALLLSKIKKGRGVIRTIFLFPMVATPIAMGYVWRIMFDSSMGFFNSVLKFFGMGNVDFFSQANVFKSLMTMEVWMGTPLIMLIVLAGISGLSHDYYESAMIDGANGFQTLFKITLPLLSPTIIMAFLLRGIEILKTYDLILATTEGGPQQMTENLNYLVYTYAFEYMQMGSGSALMIFFFLLVLGFALFSMAMKKRIEKRYE
jgi:multiple sugar transport system permease protein